MKVIIGKYLTRSDLKLSGIYFLLKGNRIVYIGKTTNLISRLYNHGNNINYDRVRLIECHGKKRMAKYEKRWIEKFKPKHNKQYLYTWLGRFGTRRQVPLVDAKKIKVAGKIFIEQ